MKRVTHPYRLMLKVLVLLALAGPVAAQEVPTNLVPFRGTLVGTGDGFVLPIDPPLGLAFNFRMPARGEVTPLGAVTFVGFTILNLGVDRKILSFSNGLAVMTAANGDAVFLSYHGLARPSEAATPTLGRYEGAFFVLGGRGRYRGADGIGIFTGTLDSTNGEFRVTLEGTLTAARP